MANRVVERFLQYVRCASEAHNERQFCLLIEQELGRLGIPFVRQEIGSELGSNGWNILAFLEGEAEKPPLLFDLHMDTVTPGDNICPTVEEGIIRSDGSTILGADGKASIAIVLEALEQILESGVQHRTVELLFTICQEAGAAGARLADCSQLHSQNAIVMDHTTLGELVCESPACSVLHIEVFGQTAHAAMEPQNGINALKAAARIVDQIQVGQVDEDSIINIGDFVSLTRTNVIPAYARFDLEVRSLRKELLRKHMNGVEEVVKTVCGQAGCTYAIRMERIVDRAKFGTDTPLISEIRQAFAQAGIESRPVRTFGYCDAAYLCQQGIQAVNIGPGIQNLHSTKEHISVYDLTCMVGIVSTLIEEAKAPSAM